MEFLIGEGRELELHAKFDDQLPATDMELKLKYLSARAFVALQALAAAAPIYTN